MPHGRPRTDTQPPRRQYGSTPVPGQARSSQRPTGPFVRSISGHLAWRPPDRSCHTDSNPLATGYCTSTDSITLSDGIGQEERAPSRRYGASDAWSALPSVPYPNGHYALCRRFRLGVFMVTRGGKLCGPNWRFSLPGPAPLTAGGADIAEDVSGRAGLAPYDMGQNQLASPCGGGEVLPRLPLVLVPRGRLLRCTIALSRGWARVWPRSGLRTDR